MKHICDNCNKEKAVWCYMPKAHYLCDNCITPSNPGYKGCSCNWFYLENEKYLPPLINPNYPEGKEGKDWKWVDKGISWQKIDEKGRPYPCSEYEYSEEGWSESFIEKLASLDEKETYQEALKLINSFYSDWLRTGYYDTCDGLIKIFIEQNFSLSLNLNLLLLTNLHKTKLNKAGKHRNDLFNITRNLYIQQKGEEKAKLAIDYLE